MPLGFFTLGALCPCSGSCWWGCKPLPGGEDYVLLASAPVEGQTECLGAARGAYRSMSVDSEGQVYVGVHVPQGLHFLPGPQAQEPWQCPRQQGMWPSRPLACTAASRGVRNMLCCVTPSREARDMAPPFAGTSKIMNDEPHRAAGRGRGLLPATLQLLATVESS